MKPLNASGSSIGLLAIGFVLASCATTEPASAPAATPTPAAHAAQPAGLTASTPRPEFPGFTLVIRQGAELYCQKRNMTGSRARVVEVCHTREEMLRMADNNDDFFKQVGNSGAHDTLRTDSPN